MSGLTKEDSGRIAFATSSLFARAVDLKEIHEWACSVIAQEESTPLYMIDLIEFKDSLFKIHQVIGFVPHWPYPPEQKAALAGIAYKRGRDPFDPPVTREEGLQLLKRYPHIEARFRAEFPFVSF